MIYIFYYLLGVKKCFSYTLLPERGKVSMSFSSHFRGQMHNVFNLKNAQGKRNNANFGSGSEFERKIRNLSEIPARTGRIESPEKGVHFPSGSPFLLQYHRDACARLFLYPLQTEFFQLLTRLGTRN